MIKKQTAWALLLCPLFLAACPASSPGATHQVPGGFSTITAAIAAASSGDTIRVTAGTYSPAANSETFPLRLDVELYLLGAGAESCTLDAASTDHVLLTTNPAGGRISGFTITGGFAVRGSGIWVKAGNIEIDRNMIRGNAAMSQGATPVSK